MWSARVTMKPFAVRSLGLGVFLLTLIQLPALASRPAAELLSGSFPGPSPELSFDTPQQSQLLAIALTVRNLQAGDEGADVRILQRYLSRNGLYPFEIDGIYGQETLNSVATYQRIRDLPATGIADEETLTDMEFDFLPASQVNNNAIPLPPSSSRSTAIRSGTLGPGSSGPDVIALQQRLNDFGIPVFVDGQYGFETQQGVRTYQRVQGLNVSGTADRDTLRAMGISASRVANENRYVAAVILKADQLGNVQQFFADAYVDRNRRGEFINIGNFDSRFPAEARVNAAIARGFRTRVLYR